MTIDKITVHFGWDDPLEVLSAPRPPARLTLGLGVRVKKTGKVGVIVSWHPYWILYPDRSVEWKYQYEVRFPKWLFFHQKDRFAESELEAI